MKPTVGRIVHVLVSPELNNGSEVAPAVITRVFSENCVNVRVLLDASPAAVHEWATSRRLHATEAEAREAVRRDTSTTGLPVGFVNVHAFWPTRA